MRNRLLVLGAALAAFGASLFAGFHFDDYAIFSDPRFTGGPDWKAIWASPQPLTDATFRLSYWMGGRDPFAYHLFSLALELAVVALAYACLRRMVGERAGFAAALVFALHPLQAEAVNYVAARGELLGALFGFTALLAWLRGLKWSALPWLALALLANGYFAGLAVLMGMAGTAEAWGAGAVEQAEAPGAVLNPSLTPLRVWLGRILRLAPMGGALLLSAAAVVKLAYSMRTAHGVMAWPKYLLGEGPAIWRYLRLLVFPYGFTADPDVHVPAVWIGVLAWAALLAAAVCAWKWRRSGWTFWLLAGLALVLPGSSALAQRDLYADSRMYLPMLAFAAAAGWLLTRVKTQALVATAAVVLAALSVARTTVWMSDKWLWQEAVRRAPEKARPKVELSRDLPAADALDLLARAQAAAPHDPTIPAEMGKVLLQERQVDPALMAFGQALALDPNNAEYFNDRGVALAMSGWTDRARADFQRALEIDPNLTEATENLKKLPPAQ
jgi:tetratricopeptide (TPR) repeat protein